MKPSSSPGSKVCALCGAEEDARFIHAGAYSQDEGERLNICFLCDGGMHGLFPQLQDKDGQERLSVHKRAQLYWVLDGVVNKALDSEKKFQRRNGLA